MSIGKFDNVNIHNMFIFEISSMTIPFLDININMQFSEEEMLLCIFHFNLII